MKQEIGRFLSWRKSVNINLGASPQILAHTLIALLLISVRVLCAAELNNGGVRAELDARGLTSLTAGSNRIGFAAEEFAIVIDGEVIGSSGLPMPSFTQESSSVHYVYQSSEFAIEVVYEVRRNWKLLTKQIRITKSSRGKVRIGRVTVFRDTLAAKPQNRYVCSRVSEALDTQDCGDFLRFSGGHGLLALVQNPFLHVQSDGGSFDISYEADLEWDFARGPFVSDVGVLFPYRSTGRRWPATMLPEWKLPVAEAMPGMDEAEVHAYEESVRTFLLDHHPRPVNVFVGWCVNDYQIDIATPEGRTEYKRVISRASEMGAQQVLFAPANSALSLRAMSTDDWGWENLLWLGLGQKIRKGEWNIQTDPIPESVAEMVQYARSKRVTLLAYVYPVLGFLASAHPEWMAPNKKPERADLGNWEYQDWLIEALVHFAQRTAIGGYSFDHAFLNFEGSSRYAQWRGWRRVMEELRRRMPEMVIDGRQAYHMYGPWSWLAGTYPHPTANDEQPESFVPFPDLHFDRVSANRLRYTNWRYRNFEFAPSELVPGFIGHQTPRIDESGELPVRLVNDRRWGVQEQVPLPFHLRDWDYLGWRYSLLSSIATGGLNNVLNMIPARDLEEYRLFPREDLLEFRKWIDWTSQNERFLRNTRTIIGPPAVGAIDGTSAIVNGRGYIFLFNPNGRRLNAEFKLDSSIGLQGAGPYVLEELYPLAGRRIGKPGAGFWSYGDEASLALDGTGVLVMRIGPAGTSANQLFNAPGTAAARDGVLALTDVRGEPGTTQELLVANSAKPQKVEVNGNPVQFDTGTNGVTRIKIHFAGSKFGRSEQVDLSGSNGIFSGHFSIPKRVFDQLAERRKRYPIPWTKEDYKTTWLAPERLLLFLQMADPDDEMKTELKLNGQEVQLEKAYSSVRVHKPSFVGFYADLSTLEPDREYKVELRIPEAASSRFQGLFFDNVEPEYTSTLLHLPL